MTETLISSKKLLSTLLDYGSAIKILFHSFRGLFELEVSEHEKTIVGALCQSTELIGAQCIFVHTNLRNLSDSLRFFGQPCKTPLMYCATYLIVLC